MEAASSRDVSRASCPGGAMSVRRVPWTSGAEGFGTLGGETETVSFRAGLPPNGTSEWTVGTAAPKPQGPEGAAGAFSDLPRAHRRWAGAGLTVASQGPGLSGTWPLRETKSPGGLNLVVRCPSQKQLAASTSPFAPPGRVREGGGTPAAGCREGGQAPAALASAGSSGTGPCEGRGAACQGPPSGQQGPAGVPEACAGLPHGASLSLLRERLQTGARPPAWSRRRGCRTSSLFLMVWGWELKTTFL